MALTAWKGAVVRKGDIFIAKNYLSKDEIDSLNRLTIIFLDSAEMRVKDRRDLTLDFWRDNIDKLLEFQGRKILSGRENISNTQMEKMVAARYEEFNKRRKIEDIKNADIEDMKELYKLLEKK